MFLPLKGSLRLPILYMRRWVGFSNSRDFHLTHFNCLRKVASNRRRTSEVQDFESPSVAGEFSVDVTPKNVNDNFFGIESDEGVIVVNSKPSLNNTSKQSFKPVEAEKLITTTFGTVRYDSENKPKYHGALEKEKLLISSNVERNKIRDLSRALQSKSSANSQSMLSEKSSKTDVLNKNLESKLPTDSYIEDIYFPELYNQEDKNISNSKSSSASCNEDKVNFIEESYFNNETTNEISENTDIASKNLPFLIHEKSTESITKKEFSSCEIISSLKSSPSSSIDQNPNYIDEYYFGDKINDDAISKNFMPSKKNYGIDKNNPMLAHDKLIKNITDDKQSNIFEEHYFNTISEIADKNLDSVRKIVNIKEYKSDQEKSTKTSTIEKDKVLEKSPLINEPEADLTDLVTSKHTTLTSTNSVNIQETDANEETFNNLNENTKAIDAVNKDEQLTLQWNDPSLEELHSYNKFLPDSTQLPKTKNDFKFETKEFLKKQQKNSATSRSWKPISLQRNIDKQTEKNQDEEKVDQSPQETHVKVQKEVNVEKSNANEQPKTAEEFVKKLRSTKRKLDSEFINGKYIQKTEQYDSKGFRILKNQVPDLKYYTSDEILELLTKNVLYSDDDLIVLNKPYNLVMHESKTTKDPCLSQYLDKLAAELDKKTYKPKLITVHRLDKETSGCLLLARNEDSAQRLLSLFSQRKIVKTYWIVTIKVPDPLEGVIDMPISEGSVDGRARMVLHPQLPKDVPYHSNSKHGRRAVTHYKVIAESGNAAIVEARPETGIKHQIRVHFGFGLSCPILGDHKYSHLNKLAPQKLQADLLQRLFIRQSKVRYVPMHIYARSIFIPQYKDGKNLFVMAPMPLHMSKNLQKLKFKKN